MVYNAFRNVHMMSFYFLEICVLEFVFLSFMIHHLWWLFFALNEVGNYYDFSDFEWMDVGESDCGLGSWKSHKYGVKWWFQKCLERERR